MIQLEINLLSIQVTIFITSFLNLFSRLFLFILPYNFGGNKIIQFRTCKVTIQNVFWKLRNTKDYLHRLLFSFLKRLLNEILNAVVCVWGLFRSNFVLIFSFYTILLQFFWQYYVLLISLHLSNLLTIQYIFFKCSIYCSSINSFFHHLQRNPSRLLRVEIYCVIKILQMKANDFFDTAKQCLTHSKALNKIEIFQWLKKCLLWIFLLKSTARNTKIIKEKVRTTM